MRKALLHNLIAYAVAFGIILYLLRGIALPELLWSFKRANLWLFLPAAVLAFLIWFLGETYLFSRLFSYFHGRISFREMLAPNAAQYFLQLINLAVAGSALVVFVHRRKRAPWIAVGCTLVFQSLIDLQIIALMALIVAAFSPGSILRHFWYYSALAALPLWLNMWFWTRGRPTSQLAQWIYDRPSLMSFRIATPRHYAELGLIRAGIFVGEALMLYCQMRGFRIEVPLSQVLAFFPIFALIAGVPVTPVGLGPLQAALVKGFEVYASKPVLVAAALSVGLMPIMFRIPLGLGSAGTFAREVMEAGEQTVSSREQQESAPQPQQAMD